MTIQEKLEPLSRWTVADVQQWCRENPWLALGGDGNRSGNCVVARIASQMAGSQVHCGLGFLYLDAHPLWAVELNEEVFRAVQRFDHAVWRAGHATPGKSIPAIEAAALMWPEVFADEAKRLVESAQEAAAQC